MSFIDTYTLEKNKNLARQTESLRGLSFMVTRPPGSQFMVLATDVSARGDAWDAYIIGICTARSQFIGDVDHAFAVGQVFRFNISEISFTIDALDTLEIRLAKERS